MPANTYWGHRIRILFIPVVQEDPLKLPHTKMTAGVENSYYLGELIN